MDIEQLNRFALDCGKRVREATTEEELKYWSKRESIANKMIDKEMKRRRKKKNDCS